MKLLKLVVTRISRQLNKQRPKKFYIEPWGIESYFNNENNIVSLKNQSSVAIFVLK